MSLHVIYTDCLMRKLSQILLFRNICVCTFSFSNIVFKIVSCIFIVTVQTVDYANIRVYIWVENKRQIFDEDIRN